MLAVLKKKEQQQDSIEHQSMYGGKYLIGKIIEKMHVLKDIGCIFMHDNV